MRPPPLSSMSLRTLDTQRGAALMIMLIIVVLGLVTALLSSLSPSSLKSARQATTAAALAQAKDALIGDAITFGDTHSAVHGYLLCPDNAGGNPEGSAEGSCGSKDVSVIGRLPWRTLGLSTQRDGDGECLWYAVSGTYKNNPKTDLMNWDNNGQFEIVNASGVVVASNVVAVVFAPGVPLGNQNRAPDGTAPICGGKYTTANYLDSDGTINNAVVSSGVKATSQFRLNSSDQINDQMIFITKDDIWNALNKRNDFLATLDTMTRKVAECIAYFGTKNGSGINNKSLPWPAPISLADYGNNNTYNDSANLFAGRIPYQVDTAKSAVSNTISSAYLLTKGTPDVAGNYDNNCPNPNDWATIYPWWDNWKDHLFYALSDKFKPSASGGTGNCGNCVTVANGASSVAAVVMFSGKNLSALNQTRINKSIVANYLEDINASNVAATNAPADGKENYQTSAVSSTFNDILYCIKEDLSVIACP